VIEKPINGSLTSESTNESSVLRQRTRRPSDVGPSHWDMPDPRLMPVDDESDLLAIGADLEPSTLVHAYHHGIFPWPHGRRKLPWFSPNPRGILPPEKLRVSKTLRQTLRRSGWSASVNAAFPEVIDACSKRPDGDGTWITPTMKRAYTKLHELGHVHSVEVWDGATLVGGLYGFLAGGVFTGESMFHHRTDASKVAVVELAHRLVEAQGSFIDVQLVTDHLASLGAIGISRTLFVDLLRELRNDDVRMVCDRLPVARLAGIPITMSSEGFAVTDPASEQLQ
jgi:leucyl/phenylalanyl-tRNA---protein transferase